MLTPSIDANVPSVVILRARDLLGDLLLRNEDDDGLLFAPAAQELHQMVDRLSQTAGQQKMFEAWVGA